MSTSSTPRALQFVLPALLLAVASERLVAGDCNSNGEDDIADIQAGRSVDCNLNDLPDECESLPVQLGLRDVGVPVPDAPRAVVSADFNGDGLLDLATASEDSEANSVVGILLNLEDGAFGPVQTRPAGRKASAMAAADLDADGDIDLATASFDAIVPLINDGNGVFEPTESLPAPAATRFVTLADVSGDGLPEILSTNTTRDTLTVHLNQGSLQFSSGREYAVGERPESVVTIDVDADGFLDLVVTNRDSQSISILTNQGNGEFSEPSDVPTPSPRPVRTRAGDIDDDGDVDLVVLSLTDVTVLPGVAGGQFGEAIPVPLRTERRSSIELIDLDGDDDLDIVTGSASADLIEVSLNVGAGRFASPETFNTDGIPYALAPGDLDGDGDLELAYTTLNPNRLSVLWNNESGTVAFNSSTVPVGDRPHSATLGDVNGDGLDDVITANGSDRSVSVFLSVGDGTLRKLPDIGSAGAYLNSIVGGDLDGDGDLDLITAAFQSNRMQVYMNKGDGRYDPPRPYPTGARPFMVNVADFDGDGWTDLVSANEASNTVTVQFNRGNGTFGNRRDVRVGTRPAAVAPADVDGDGDFDLAVSNDLSSNLTLLFNDGTGQFDEREDHPVPGRPLYVIASDVNGDLAPDLITVSGSTQRAAVFLNDGDGGFRLNGTFPVLDPPYSCAAKDVDGDGFLDLVTANQTPNTTSLLLGNGDGTFNAPFVYATGTDPRFTVVGDLDLDGDNDLVAANHTSRDLTVLVNQSSRGLFEGQYLEIICTPMDFQNVSVAARGGSNIERVCKYVAPANDSPDLLPTVFQNSSLFDLHITFLATAFPERFPGLTVEQYNRLVGRRATRQHYVGVISKLTTLEGPRYGFSVITDTAPAELLSLQEVEGVYETLRGSFHLEPLGYLPDSSEAKRAAAEWSGATFPIYFDDGSGPTAYEPYTQAVGYGRVRILDREGFEEANSSGQVSFQNVFVLSFPPRDIEGVIGGVITEGKQQEQSHLSIRTARRNTPNAFVADASAIFAPFAGKLIRLEVGPEDIEVREAQLEEAQEFWENNRPDLEFSPEIDSTYTDLTSMEAIDLASDVPPEARFGGKAANFARLQQLLEGSEYARYREAAFAVPAAHYLEFMDTNRMSSAIDPGRTVTYREYLDELFAAPEFQSDSERRFEALERYRVLARALGRVNPDLVSAISARIAEVFPSKSTMVRFRSSSNVEDTLEFNGAGLYDSTSGCAADSEDEDGSGPSLCDETQDDERNIERALKVVWTSLHTFRAFEERAYFGVPEDRVAMAILVTRTFKDELANGVAFTGNFTNALDKSYVVTVQAGEESVVHPDPDVTAEKDVLEVVDGRLVRILRAEASSIVEPGVHVLSDANLEELASLMSFADANFPLELGSHSRDEVLLDMEIKLERGGALALKQIRPFLLSAPVPPTPEFELQIPAEVCSVFGVAGEGRGPREEYERKSVIQFHPDVVRLPTTTSFFSLDLIATLIYGPQREVARPRFPGFVRVLRLPPVRGTTTYRFLFEQEFSLSGGRHLVVRMPFEFAARGEIPVERRRVFGAEFFTTFATQEILIGELDGDPVVRYGACNHEALERWSVAADLGDGNSVRFEERWQPAENLTDTGPASLVRAEVHLGDEVRTVTDYFHLVYSASRHNTRVHHWAVLEPPVSVAGLRAPVAIVELVGPDPVEGPEQARYLDANFAVLTEPEVTAYRRDLKPEPSAPRFRRGDVNTDVTTNLTDALVLLTYLFLDGPEPGCLKAGDVDADAKLALTDGIYLLNYLFLEGPEPAAPFLTCGLDSSDELPSCNRFPACDER